MSLASYLTAPPRELKGPSPRATHQDSYAPLWGDVLTCLSLVRVIQFQSCRIERPRQERPATPTYSGFIEVYHNGAGGN